MRELVKIGLAVAGAEILFWSVGVWSWVSFSLRHWPWLLERYAVLFPASLAIVLLAMRRWRLVRSNVLVAGSAGMVAGLLSSEIALLLAQVVTAQERAIFWNTMRTASLGDTLLVEGLFAFVLTVGWLYGLAASTMIIGLDRLDELQEQRKRQAAGRTP